MDSGMIPDSQYSGPRIVLHPAIDGQVFMEVCHSDTPNALDLVLHILPAFNFHYANVVRVELYIDGTQRATRLIRKSSPDAREIFTVHDDYWQDEPDARMAVFHLTRGTSARLASGDFAPLKDIKGITYLLDFPLTSETPPIDDVVAESDASEHIDIAQADSEIWEDAHSHADSDHAGAVDDFTPTTEEHQQVESAAANTSEDNMVRLSQATREIFLEDAEPSTERPTAIDLTSLRSTVSPSPEADTEPAGPVRASTQHIGPDGPVPNISTIDEPLFRIGNRTQNAVSGNEFNLLGDASELNDSDHPMATFQPDSPDHCPTSGATNEDTLSSKRKIHSDEDEDEDEDMSVDLPIPQTMIDWKRDLENNSKKLRTLQGKDADLRLRKHAASNDKAMHSWGVPTVHRCRKLGTHQETREANTRLVKIIAKQVGYHDALHASKYLGVVAGRELLSQIWKDDKIDEYKKQLDTAISIAKVHAPSTPVAPVSADKLQAGDQQLQMPTSPIPAQRDSDAEEDLDINKLPELDSIVKPHFAKYKPTVLGVDDTKFAKKQYAVRGVDETEGAKKQPGVHGVDETEERPSKRPRFEAVSPINADRR